MCIAVPCKVLQVRPGQAEVLFDSRPQWVRATGMADLAVGEYVTVYAGSVLDRLPADEAEEVLRLFAELDAMMEVEADA